ncbi:hypothetical protein HDU96_007141 [Phlyctochytrium bullatum]|nr:hypothetical protein HDU96_007141 [Phlyctochytrium bullatum]
MPFFPDQNPNNPNQPLYPTQSAPWLPGSPQNQGYEGIPSEPAPSNPGDDLFGPTPRIEQFTVQPTQRPAESPSNDSEFDDNTIKRKHSYFAPSVSRVAVVPSAAAGDHLGDHDELQGFWKLILPHMSYDGVKYSQRTLIVLIVYSTVTVILQSILVWSLNRSFGELEKELRNSTDAAVMDSLDLTLLLNIKAGNVQQNLVQILAVDIYNLVLFIFTIIQIGQLNGLADDINREYQKLDSSDPSFSATIIGKLKQPGLQANQIVVSILAGTWLLYMVLHTNALRKEFSWAIYRRIGGNIDLEKKFRCHHILQLCNRYAILCVGLFQALILVMADQTELNIILTFMIGLPLLVLIPVVGYVGVRREWFLLLLLNIVLDVLFAGYVCYRFYDMVSSGGRYYERVRHVVVQFGVACLLLLTGSVVTAVICWRNFGSGLKEVLTQSKLKNLEEVKVIDLEK